MKKAREFWIFREDIKLMNLHHHVIGPNGVHLKEDSTALERPEEWIHVREVLDPDPKDEVIKILKDGLKRIQGGVAFHHKEFDDGGSWVSAIYGEIMGAVEKLEKGE